MTRPTIGRTVHFVMQDEAGRMVHRTAWVCEPLATGDGYDCSLHVLCKPGDRLPANLHQPGMQLDGIMGYVPRAIRARPDGTDEDTGLLATWHYPEGSADAKPPTIPARAAAAGGRRGGVTELG